LIFDSLLAGFNFTLFFGLASLLQLGLSFESSLFFGVEIGDLFLFALLLFYPDILFYFVKEFLTIVCVVQTGLALENFRRCLRRLSRTAARLTVDCCQGRRPISSLRVRLTGGMTTENVWLTFSFLATELIFWLSNWVVCASWLMAR